MIFFITGVGSGIGKETCLAALSNNHHVIGLLRNHAQAELLIKEAELAPGKLSLVHADLEKDGFEELVLANLRKLDIDRVDVLINVAGALNSLSINEFRLEDINRVMKVNFISPALLIKTLVPFLAKSVKANIVNITSMSGFQGSVRFPGLSIYGASKAALSSLTESLSVELSSQNIHINALALGAVNTEMLKSAFPDYQAPVSPVQMAEYIYSFATKGYLFYDGKTLPVAITNP